MFNVNELDGNLAEDGEGAVDLAGKMNTAWTTLTESIIISRENGENHDFSFGLSNGKQSRQGFNKPDSGTLPATKENLFFY